MIKVNYEKPQINVSAFPIEDVVSTSGGGVVLPPDEFETTTNPGEIVLPPDELGK